MWMCITSWHPLRPTLHEDSNDAALACVHAVIGVSRSLLVMMSHGQGFSVVSELAQIDDSHGPRQMCYSTLVCPV